MNKKGDEYMNTEIEVNSVSKTFGKGTNLNKVLDEASMYVSEGEFVSLMGASGSGKSTLLYLIGGLDRDFEGKIKALGGKILMTEFIGDVDIEATVKVHS